MPKARDAVEGGEEGSEGGGGLAGTPSSLAAPENESSILLAPKAPKQILAASLKHWKGRRGDQGGVPPPPPTAYGRSNTSLPKAPKKYVL